MTRSFKASEIHVVAGNEPGTIMKLTAPISKAGVNVNASWAYGKGNEGHFYFITSDNAKATDALKKAGFTWTKNDVVVFETDNKPGELYTAAQKLANAGINVDYYYATSANEKTTWIVFATKDPDKTLKVFS